MIDLNKKSYTANLNGKEVKLEISKLAEQANAAVFGHYGQTVVMATAVMGKEDRDIDYMPLTVDFEERFYSVGKLLGSQFVRREGRAGENAILAGRMIDRTIRPLFNHNIRRDIQVVVTLLSYEEGCDPIFIGLLATSTALAISNIPWNGPVAGVPIKKIGLHPEPVEGFIAGTAENINMIELGGLDVPEKEIVSEFAQAHQQIGELVKLQKNIIKELGKEKAEVAMAEPDGDLKKKIHNFLADKIEAAVYVKQKTERLNNITDLQKQLVEFLATDDEKVIGQANHLFEEEVDAVVHKNILEKDQRPDFRKLDEVRDLHAEVGLFERLHGSALFIRGNTQALAITTLGPPDSAQKIEGATFSGKKDFMLHYNFPPYSTGETGRLGGPGRREIGHGNLAEKALRGLIPTKEEFPYTIRIVSEILSSNGSSSMASTCAGCLSLMDAGVPIKKMAAGIAMGLMTDNKGNYKILTDIQGPEDHYGDMDFKVAGTEDGVNAIQMDVKIGGINTKILEEALAQAKKARLEIMAAMKKALVTPRPNISKYAPVILSLVIDPSKIGEVIGAGGKVINKIIANTGATTIDIEQEGKVFVTAPSKEIADRAMAIVEAITHDYKVGEIVEGTIVKIMDFGAILEFAPNRDGMIHISEMKEGYVKNVEEVVKLGDFVRARIIKVEPEGRIGLSLRGLK